MQDFRINVSAETQAAERKLQQVDKLADRTTRARSLNIDLRHLNRGFNNLQKDIQAASNNIRTFYSVSKNIPGVGDKVKQFEDLAKNTANTAKQQFQLGTSLKETAKAGNILARSLELAGTTGGRLINVLAKLGFATFALKEAVGVVQAAWNGFFNNTIGREIKLRETILKTQTTLASTNKVFANGREITDPYQKIVSLTGAVRQNIDSIRERSIALAGVTSNEVIEVFGIVAGQIGQIGGGLKEAEDLAINFAAALGTFGIPLYQARQEVGSILRGDITMDSYLAKALGITNDDIAKAKSQAGGVVKFLEERLAAAVAGQKIAAQGFAGVVSNIQDLGELIGQNFGRGLLDPLLAGLTNVFETLFKIRQQLFDIAAGAGKAIGTAGRLVIGLTTGRTGLGAGDPSKAASAAAKVAERGFQEVQRVAQRTVGALSQAIEALKPTALILVDAFRNITEAFVAIKVGTFEALASALANIASVVGTLAPPLATVFNLYARFLNTPAIRYFSEVAAVLGLLKRVGLDAATQLVLFGRFIVSAVIPSIGALGAALAVLVGGIAAVALAIGKLILIFAGLATALVGPAAAIPALAVGLKALAVELTSVGTQATGASTRLGALATGFRGAGAAAKAAGASILASLGWIAAIQIGIAVLVDAFGRFQRAQEDQRSNARAQEALRRLQTTYKDVGDSADSATKAARDFEQAIVDANYSRNTEQLEEVRKKINQIRYELKPGIQSWREFWDALSGSEAGRFEERSKQILQGLKNEEQKIKDQLRGVDQQRDRKRAEENIKLEAQNRSNLEKEIGDLRRQQEDQIFQLRQQQAQKEVEIFRLAGELRIFQMEQANAKLIEGEEGASAAALESLNNYLSIRERGELDIEASKKDLAIEAANLEKQIADYRLENEKKIAEIRKRAGDYEKKVADYQRQMAAAPVVTQGTVRGGAVVTQRNDRDGEQTGSDIVIAGGRGAAIQNPFQNLKITGKGFQGSGSGSSGRGFGNYVTGTVLMNGKTYEVLLGHLDSVAVNVGDVLGAGGVLGTQGITGRATGPHVTTHVNALNGGDPGGVLRAIENAWVRGGVIQSASQQGSTAQVNNPVAPQAPTYDDIGTPAIERYASAVRNLSGAMERARALQEALTNAKTAAAFEEIAKAAFPKVNVEQYRDQLIEAKNSLEALASTAGDAYDPERLRIAVDYQTRLAVQEEELAQIRAKAKQRLSPAELKRLEDDLTKRKAEFVAQLQNEKQLREQLLPLVRAQAAIEELRAETRQIGFDTQRAGLQAFGQMAAAFGNPEDVQRQRLLEAEIRIAERRIQLEEKYVGNIEAVQKELAPFAEAVRDSARVLGEMDVVVQNFLNVMGVIRESARTMTDGYKGFFKEILTGGDLQQAMNSMLESITERFLTMALDAAFKPMEALMVEQLKNLFGITDPAALMAEQQRVASQGLESAGTTLQTAGQSLQQAAQALQTAATTRPLPSAAPLPGQSGPQSQRFDSVMRNGQIVPLPLAPATTPQALEVVPFRDAAEATGAITQLSENATAASSTLPQLSESTTALTEAAGTTAQNIQAAGARTTQLTEQFNGLMKAAGSAMTVLGGIAMGYAGAQQMSKGGTYNTLMGIAGIFGAIGTVAGGIGSGLPARAMGGPVYPNQAYLVGERGKELFVPEVAGTIVPNNYLRSGGSSGPGPEAAFLPPPSYLRRSPDGPEAPGLLGAVQAALADAVITASGRLEFKYESTVINNVEYVTAEQFRRGMADAAERGKALTLSSIRNSVKTRKDIGF